MPQLGDDGEGGGDEVRARLWLERGRRSSDIVGARASVSYLPLWLRLWMTTGTYLVNLKVARAA
jgi:hypothetical protein